MKTLRRAIQYIFQMTLHILQSLISVVFHHKPGKEGNDCNEKSQRRYSQHSEATRAKPEDYILSGVSRQQPDQKNQYGEYNHTDNNQAQHNPPGGCPIFDLRHLDREPSLMDYVRLFLRNRIQAPGLTVFFR